MSGRPIEGVNRKLQQMCDLLRHRGPDDHGFLTWRDGEAFSRGRNADQLPPGRIALVHTRLSILDLSPSGWQPMLSTSGDAAIVFNGEIYNYRELREELEAEGQQFQSTTDTEVLLKILARDWTDGLSRLAGMYAFAFVDLTRRRMLLARDPFGIKPLHYTLAGGSLAFASEIKPLLALGAARALVNRRALFRYLRHGVTNAGGETVFQDISELEPGHVIECDLETPGNLRRRCFWRPRPPARPRSIKPGDAADELKHLFKKSVALHMRADVPCAAALSGGVDSGGIACMMRQHLGAGSKLSTFTYVADQAGLNELALARVTANSIGADMTEVRLNPDNLAGEIDDLITRQEQPITTTSIWAQAHVHRAVARAGFKIVLDGQGGDECFAGYPVFHAARLNGLLRRGHLLGAARFLSRLPDRRLATTLLGLGQIAPGYAKQSLRRIVGRPLVPSWLARDWFGSAAHDIADEPIPAHSPLSSALAEAVSGTSLPMLLRYADRNAMAVSVENRVPFLTTELAEFAMALPDEILISPDGVLKSVLRGALRGLVPDEVLDRRQKIGFETPEAVWYRTRPSVQQIALRTAEDLPLPPCFNPQVRDDLLALGRADTAFSPHLGRALILTRWASLMGAEFPAGCEASAEQ